MEPSLLNTIEEISSSATGSVTSLPCAGAGVVEDDSHNPLKLAVIDFIHVSKEVGRADSEFFIRLRNIILSYCFLEDSLFILWGAHWIHSLDGKDVDQVCLEVPGLAN